MNIWVCFRSLLKIVGASPTNFPLCPCGIAGIATGGGPHPPLGGPAPGGPPPPPGYPPPPRNPLPPLGNPPLPGSPPLGNPLPGLSSCGSLIGGSSGSSLGPPLGGSAQSGPVACRSAASLLTMLTI